MAELEGQAMAPQARRLSPGQRHHKPDVTLTAMAGCVLIAIGLHLPIRKLYYSLDAFQSIEACHVECPWHQICLTTLPEDK